VFSEGWGRGLSEKSNLDTTCCCGFHGPLGVNPRVPSRVSKYCMYLFRSWADTCYAFTSFTDAYQSTLFVLAMTVVMLVARYIDVLIY